MTDQMARVHCIFEILGSTCHCCSANMRWCQMMVWLFTVTPVTRVTASRHNVWHVTLLRSMSSPSGWCNAPDDRWSLLHSRGNWTKSLQIRTSAACWHVLSISPCNNSVEKRFLNSFLMVVSLCWSWLFPKIDRKTNAYELNQHFFLVGLKSNTDKI